MKKTITLLLLAIRLFAIAQTGDPSLLTDLFNKYSKHHLQEKLFVHTDRICYLAGDIIWLKVYATDGIMQQPLDLSKVAYLELLTADNKIISQSKLALEKAVGSGSLSLPFNLNSGLYKLRAYTSLMKNAGAAYFFEKELTIINTLKTTTNLNPVVESRYDIQFFPEGGSLVEGLKNNVAFKIIDNSGDGVDATGFILNEKNDTVARLATLKFGMGRFTFIPLPGVVYSAVLNLPGNHTITAKLPVAQQAGYALALEEDQQGKLILQVSGKDLSPQRLTLLVHTRQVVRLLLKATTENGSVVFVIDKNAPGEGISQFTVFDERNRPVCERLYFGRPSNNLRIIASTDSNSYSKRKPVNIKVDAGSQHGAMAALSMAVTLNDSLSFSEKQHILSYLWLASDLRGQIEDADYYFEDSSDVSNRAADNLMMTQGWRRFTWNAVLQSDPGPQQYHAEIDGHIVQATIIDKHSNLPAPDVTTFLSVPGKYFRTANAISDKNGQICFDIKPPFGSSEMVTQANVADSNYIIDIINPFFENLTDVSTKTFSITSNWKNDLTDRSIAMQVQHIYGGDETQRYLVDSNFDTAAFYGRHAITYFLDDYTRFKTMEEVIREYVKELKLRKTKEQYRISVKAPYEEGFESDPLVLIDGIPINDINQLIAFDPLKLKRIDIVAEKYFFGTQVLGGIVSFSTYNGDLAGFTLDRSAIITDYNGMQYQRQFYSPVYQAAGSAESRIPDFRNVLYWDPYLRTDKNGKAVVRFFTSDIKGKFTVIVQGMTPDGFAGYTTTSFMVE